MLEKGPCRQRDRGLRREPGGDRVIIEVKGEDSGGYGSAQMNLVPCQNSQLVFSVPVRLLSGTR